ncbi:competence/damage-inducible protein A [Thermincola potens]|uniref:Putative competence-damage inducible protein n=1 Tax=Thermincola potens (strain JR) TaxID=635013 RepID=D5XF73_THEPJ|nr:competence/damage-inducible protein A [Thermincola potens]ADG82294.1 competence/damage-inducible protein CinA [Thermincola potens JR]
MKTEIINTGTELLTGRTRNANAHYLARELMLLGIRTWRQTTIGDYEKNLKDALKSALAESDLVFVTGGLGPTVDDITKESLAAVLGLEMQLHEASLERIRAFFAARGVDMPEANRKQALLPVSALALTNEVGTAPGFILEARDKIFVVLPGPPWELQPMFEQYVKPYLKKKGLTGADRLKQKTIKLWGIGESAVQDLLADLHRKNGNVEIAYQAQRGEVWVKLLTENGAANGDELEQITCEITTRLGNKVFGFDEDTMEMTVARLLVKHNLTVSLAESCTGGLIAKKLTDLPGSSEYLMYGVVSYSNEAKEKILGVSPETLKQFGAVSSETALEMARGVKKLGNTDVAVSVTGIAGPGGGSPEKPVGLVYTGLAHKDGAFSQKHLFYGDRENIRELSARAALNMLRLYILENYS